MKNIPLKSFSNFVLRTPLLPVNVFFELTKNTFTNSDNYLQLFKKPIVEEAIFMASPHLYEQLSKWSQGIITDKKKIEKIKISFCKYISRMSSRCTPFGTFAGCSVGSLGDETKIIRHSTNMGKKNTRLDMNYLVALANDISKMRNIRVQIKFYPNSSIYEVGKQIRYIEYKYVKGSRTHYSMAVDNSIYLKKVLEIAQKGSKLQALIDCLVSDSIDSEEASLFVNELIDSQILVSELEPPTIGEDFLLHIRKILKNLKNTEHIILLLDGIQENLNKLSSQFILNHEYFSEIFRLIDLVGTEYDKKYLFQTDFTPSLKTNKLDNSQVESVKKAILLFNKITPVPSESDLESFKIEFQKRFEDREIPLAKALDVECGIGYLQNNVDNDINPLVDDLVIPLKKGLNNINEIKYTTAEKIIKQKIDSTVMSGDSKVNLSFEEFKEFQTNWKDVPDTFSSISELIIEEGTEKIKLSGAGGVSAANLLGRFCYMDEKITRLCEEITSHEDCLNSNLESAEISHLPESRIGNILLRPSFRNYEIPYLASSNLPINNQISINDLFISLQNGELKLKSKKLNKFITTKLTNAHNYSSKSLPIYHFLCDLQTQNKRVSLYFGLGKLFEDYDFIPRIELDNVILFEATWILKSDELKSLLIAKTNNEILDTFFKLKEERKLPDFVRLIDGDNLLLVNLNNLDSLKGLINESKRKSKIILKEFLFSPNDSVVKMDNSEACFTNQVIISFYKN